MQLYKSYNITVKSLFTLISHAVIITNLNLLYCIEFVYCILSIVAHLLIN